MKTFIIALLIMALVLCFVIWNSISITKKIDALLKLAQSFPDNAEAFESHSTAIAADVEKFYALWDKTITRLAYTSGYENLNRADAAVILLYAGYQNRCATDFVNARYDFIDALSRLRELERLRIPLKLPAKEKAVA